MSPAPGFTEIDPVSHSGECADGEFAHSFNLADIHTTRTETRAVRGKGQMGIVAAFEQAVPLGLVEVVNRRKGKGVNRGGVTRRQP